MTRTGRIYVSNLLLHLRALYLANREETIYTLSTRLEQSKDQPEPTPFILSARYEQSKDQSQHLRAAKDSASQS